MADLEIVKMSHLANDLPQMIHPPKFTLWMIALNLSVDLSGLSDLIFGSHDPSYLSSYFGYKHTPLDALW